jgi:hypothetical protein
MKIWTQAQVEHLMARQTAGHMHPYVCYVCEGDVTLLPTSEGWFCTECETGSAHVAQWDLEGRFASTVEELFWDEPVGADVA